MSSWWTGLAPSELQVSCGRHKHRVRWRAGQLDVLDHPDADRERALIALGGNPSACLEILDAWQQHADELDVLVLASRGSADQLPPDYSVGHGLPRRYASYTSSNRPHNLSGWTRYSSQVLHQEPRRPLEQLLGLGGGLASRLVATVIATWAERVELSDPRVAAASRQLRAALYGRFACAVHEWTAGADPVELTMIGPGEPPKLTQLDGMVRAELPFAWLRDVWARGLSTILGRLCLAAEPDGAGEWRLLTVGYDLGEARSTIRMR